ncbi:DNA replication initiation control protein YabA [Streptococcus moroccensis]|uniref:Regulator of replication initiation timing n=1 Tax=Streptococcus moroccensis TaxID=1451356 RepID=A0ABT9YQK8_9STRE|nr:DNA replication initiation control protein YabA [Streptococcus moroccensis]MDQ0222284.1 regulator of replication initiation timing [Streptococcus moroccensis]
MDKRDLFNALDTFSQDLMQTLAEVESIKIHLQELAQENTALRLENDKLRERLFQEESSVEVSKKRQRNTSVIEKNYDEGFHICKDFFGQRRDNDEPCLMCLEVIYREDV